MDVEQISDFERRLRELFERPLPGPLVQRQMAPELAFGRHRGPLPPTARQAAVLMLVHPADDAADTSTTEPSEPRGTRTAPSDWIVPAIVRPQHMKFHAGQIALPGGIVEPGESLLEAALREFEEELGPAIAPSQVLGQLTPIYVYASQALVTPFLGFARARPTWQPSADEVAGIVEIRLAELLSPTTRGQHTIRRRGLTMLAPHYDIAGYQIWGATAMILAEFAAVLSAARLQTGEPPLAGE